MQRLSRAHSCEIVTLSLGFGLKRFKVVGFRIQGCGDRKDFGFRASRRK